MSTETPIPITTAKLRAEVKATSGLLTFGKDASDSNLPELYRLMGKDIVTWLDPTQGWKFVEVRGGFIVHERISQHFVGKRKPRDNSHDEADQSMVFFHFDAEHPPISKGAFGRGRERVDLAKVFFKEYREDIRLKLSPEKDEATVIVEHIGPVFPIDEAIKHALKSPTTPYYLAGDSRTARAWVTLNIRPGGPHYYDKYEHEFPGSLSVNVIMRDLGDYVRLESNRLKRAGYQIAKHFPVSSLNP